MKKEIYEIDLKDILLRRANKKDNFKEIAILLYQTDPYIYPFWFNNNIEECIDFLKDKIDKPGFIFHYDNIYIAYHKKNNKIVGVLNAIDPSVNLEFDYEPYTKINKNYYLTINKYIKECIEESKRFDGIYIMNLAVLEEYRGQKIGTKLMGHFIKNMEKAGFDKYSLDCLLHNLRAKNLYHSMGFKEIKEIVGFDGTDNSQVEVVNFVRHKGNYLPEEFK